MQGSELVGFASAGVKAIGPFEHRLRPGLTALYGKNGAGKSTVLSELLAAVTPASSPPDPSRLGLCIRVLALEPFSDLDQALEAQIRDGLGRGDPDPAIEALWESFKGSDVISAELVAGVAAMNVGSVDDPSVLQTFTRWASSFELWCTPGTTTGLEGFTLYLAVSPGLEEVGRAQEVLLPFWPHVGSPVEHHLDQLVEGFLEWDDGQRLELLHGIVSSRGERGRRAWDEEDAYRAAEDPAVARELYRDLVVSPSYDIDTFWEISEPLAGDLGELPAALLVQGVGKTMQARGALGMDLPIPVVALTELTGTTTALVPAVRTARFDDTVDMAAHLEEITIRGFSPLVEAVDGEDFILAEWAAEKQATIIENANMTLSDLLEDAPQLRATVCHPNQWPFRPAVEWSAVDDGSEQAISISQLSEAQKRWATFAINWAVRPEMFRTYGALTESRPTDLLLFDEPERALHVAATAKLVAGLKRLAAQDGPAVVVATHSPAFLNDPEVQLIHVAREAGGPAQIRPLLSPLTPTAEALGLTAAEVLQIVRTFVMVEGEHDVAVLEALLGEELVARRAAVLPIRGANHLRSLVDSRILLDSTTARIVVMVDNAGDPAFLEAIHALLGSGAGEKRRALDQAGELRRRRRLTHEQELICEMAIRVIERGVTDRFAVHALPVQDVIELLPVEHFVPGDRSWAELRAEHKAGGSAQDFKSWLRTEYGARVSVRAIKASAAHLDHIPRPITDLIRLLHR